MATEQPMNPKLYAYLGDGIYELTLRQWAIELGYRQMNQTHRWVAHRASGKFQATLVPLLEPHLTEEELGIFKQGRNASLTVAKRHDQAVHRLASGVETLLGYWHTHAPDRLTEMMGHLKEAICSEIHNDMTD